MRQNWWMSTEAEMMDDDLAGEFRGIADDAVAADDAVVGDVHVFHQKVVRTDDGHAFRRCSTRNRDVFADGIVIANLAGRDFTLEF